MSPSRGGERRRNEKKHHRRITFSNKILAQRSRNQKEFNHEEKLTKFVLMKLFLMNTGNWEWGKEVFAG